MSFYQSPIRPYDPVIQDVGAGSRYLRDNFSNTGQDSHTEPPAQDQSLWSLLKNVMPITKGTLERRWGYSVFANGLLSNANKLYSYQRDSDGFRAIITTGGTSVQALAENGAVYNAAVYSPTSSGLVRMLTSRSYAYFFNSYAGDLKKWNGSNNDGVSNIGIGVNLVTSGSSFGPNAPSTATDVGDHQISWTNPNNAKVVDGVTATISVPAGSSKLPNTLRLTNFGLTATGLAVVGIQVDVTYSATNANALQINLTKDNGLGSPVAYGATKSAVSNPGSLSTLSFGGPTDLWGGVWTTGDTQSVSFGCDLHFSSVTVPGYVGSVVMTNPGSWTGTLSGGSFDPPTSGVTAVAQITGATNSGSPSFLSSATGLTVSNKGSGYTGSTVVTHFSVTSGTPPAGTGTIVTDGKVMNAAVDGVKITVYVQAGAGVVVGSTAGAGSVNLTVGRVYYEAFKNSLTGHYSGISAASASTGPLTNKQIALTLDQCTDPQVDTNVILATADGGDPSILYLLAEVPASQTAYTDNITEAELVNSQVLLFTDDFGTETGIADNDPPPVAGALVIKHQGRLWMGSGQYLYFSKSVADLTMPNGFIAGKYEEAWPSDNYFDISEGAETVSALLSDGANLYIGTENHVRVLTGDDPTNFSLPAIVHPNVGVLNQDVWQLVYLEGSPAGSIWLTPDFRVIGSDFNTYIDIGHPVQDILNSVQSTASTLAHAMLVSDGEFDLYILALPVASSTDCDTHLVYDMRSRRWFQWGPNDHSLGALFNITAAGVPQWLFTNGSSIFQYTSASSTDNGVVIPVTAKTSFLHLGEPSTRKVLDDVEIIGDPAMTFSLEGASTQAAFASPTAIVTNSALATSPFGQQKVYLATKPCKYRYYRLTFSSSSGTQDFLDGYNLRYVPFHTL